MAIAQMASELNALKADLRKAFKLQQDVLSAHQVSTAESCESGNRGSDVV